MAINMTQIIFNPIFLAKAYCRRRHFKNKANQELRKRKPRFKAVKFHPRRVKGKFKFDKLRDMAIATFK